MSEEKKACKVYFCGNCDQKHDSRSEAEYCCKPAVYTEWECPVCKETHGTEELATACCDEEPAESLPYHIPHGVTNIHDYVSKFEEINHYRRPA